MVIIYLDIHFQCLFIFVLSLGLALTCLCSLGVGVPYLLEYLGTFLTGHLPLDQKKYKLLSYAALSCVGFLGALLLPPEQRQVELETNLREV